MKKINVYVLFDGQCEDAFNFYKSVLGGDYASVMRFSDMPPSDDIPSLPEEHQNRIMHISLAVSADHVLMGSDTGGEWAADYNQGNNFSISISVESRKEADRIFNGLSDGGTVTMPMDYTFWGSYFGSFRDKFGVNWMVSFDANSQMRDSD